MGAVSLPSRARVPAQRVAEADAPGTGIRPPLVTVLVVSWNRRDRVLEALRSVRAQTYRPIEMLLVDNGSTDGLSDAVAAAFPEARIVRLDGNVGCPGGRNVGVANARGELIFFLDSDAVLDPRAVERLCARMSAPDRPMVVTARVIEGRAAPALLPSRSLAHGADVACLVPAFLGGASLHRAALFEQVGGYPAEFWYGGEEQHLTLRLLDAGFLIAYEPSARVWHSPSADGPERAENACRAWENGLTVIWQLYPLEVAIQATLRSLLVPPVRALRRRQLGLWLRHLPRQLAHAWHAVRRQRRPVRRRTIRLYHRLHSRQVTSEEEVRGILSGVEPWTIREALHLLLLFR